MILINCLKQRIHSRNYFEKKNILKDDYQKTLKKLAFEPSPFCREYYEKQKGSRTSHQSLFRLQILFRKIPFLVIYYLDNLDDLIYSGFWVIPKFDLLIYASQFTMP